ncbi:MAG: Fe(3+) ABC transporter substrate-binding protein [Gammaproteobacteria bacterium]|nr:Fe(3+) ABC transporter substrate-binding protein [Gammaproteobacteria bacterium]
MFPVKRLSVVGMGAAIILSSGAAMSDELNIYSARHYDSDEQLYSLFTERTGIEVNVLQGNSDQLIERIGREGAASPADVLLTVDAGVLHRAETRGLFAPAESDVLTSRIPETFRDPENLWFGFSQRVRVVYYDTEQYSEPPISRYEELAEDRFEGEICIRSSSNIYNQSLIAAFIDIYGEEETEAWSAGLMDNLARTPQGGDTDQIRALAAGECSIAVGNHYYWVRLLLSDDPADRAVAERAGVIFPNQEGRGTHSNVAGAGMIANAPNPESAVAFLEFLASDEAQRLFGMGNHEFPVVEGVEPVDAIQPWVELKTDPLNVSRLGENNPAAVRLMDRVGWR